MTHLCISVRWLDNRYHGLLNREGPPEWPPSPFRLFQALVAGVARYGKLGGEVSRSLGWLESLPAPIIVAPASRNGQIVRRFVPNNDGDKEPDRQKRLTEKTSRPTILLGIPEIHYLWPIPGSPSELTAVIEAAHYLTCLGWGIDMAYGDGRLLGSEDIGALEGVRWSPKPGTVRDQGLLRVPIGGSLTDLLNAHQSALNRIEHGKPLRTVEKPRVFDRVLYINPALPVGRPNAIFALKTAQDDFYRHPLAKLIHIAGMTRNASIKAMKAFPPQSIENPDEWVKSFVRGLKPESAMPHTQLSYVPLPSIGRRADAMIRRVMITGPFGCEDELRHLANQLNGEQLQPEGGGEGPILDLIRPDGVTQQYLGTSKAWASVTPVILPGHDDYKAEKTLKLIERALVQSGVEQGAHYTWGPMPNFRNCLTAYESGGNNRTDTYFRPGHLKGLTAVHMRVSFEYPVAGPLVIGAGRHCGLGVFAAMNE